MGEWGASEPVYVVFLGIGQNGPDFVRFGDGVAGLWGCMAAGFGAASSESDRIALILSDFGEGCFQEIPGRRHLVMPFPLGYAEGL